MLDIQDLKQLDLFGKRVNLRFQGNDYYKTYCGALATVIMFVSLIVLFTVSSTQIIRGKIDSMNYMIKRKRLDGFREKDDSEFSYAMQYEVFGFGVQSKALRNNSFMNIEIKLQKNGRKVNDMEFYNLTVYSCTEDVYQNISRGIVSDIPSDLQIRCIKVPMRLLELGYSPTVFFRECQNESIGCAPEALRDEYLREFYIWAFSRVDQSDFTTTSTRLINRFRASSISVSNMYKKRSTVYLREVDILTVRGLFIPKKKRQRTNLFSRYDQNIVSLGKYDSMMLELNLKIETTEQVLITKKFTSLLDLCAFLGGFSKGIGLILMVMVIPVREVLFYRKLMNHMFSICINREQLKVALSLSNAQDLEDFDEEVQRLTTSEAKEAVSEFQRKTTSYKGRSGKRKRGKRSVKTKTSLKEELRKFKKKFKKYTGKNVGLYEAMAASYLTKDKIFDNMKNAFKDKEKTPRTLSMILAAGFGKKKKHSIHYRNPEENFDENGEMKPLENLELDLLNRSSIRAGIGRWVYKAKNWIEKKRALEKLREKMSDRRRRTRAGEIFEQLRSNRQKMTSILKAASRKDLEAAFPKDEVERISKHLSPNRGEVNSLSMGDEGASGRSRSIRKSRVEKRLTMSQNKKKVKKEANQSPEVQLQESDDIEKDGQKQGGILGLRSAFRSLISRPPRKEFSNQVTIEKTKTNSFQNQPEVQGKGSNEEEEDALAPAQILDLVGTGIVRLKQKEKFSGMDHTPRIVQKEICDQTVFTISDDLIHPRPLFRDEELERRQDGSQLPGNGGGGREEVVFENDSNRKTSRNLARQLELDMGSDGLESVSEEVDLEKLEKSRRWYRGPCLAGGGPGGNSRSQSNSSSEGSNKEDDKGKRASLNHSPAGLEVRDRLAGRNRFPTFNGSSSPPRPQAQTEDDLEEEKSFGEDEEQNTEKLVPQTTERGLLDKNHDFPDDDLSNKRKEVILPEGIASKSGSGQAKEHQLEKRQPHHRNSRRGLTRGKTFYKKVELTKNIIEKHEKEKLAKLRRRNRINFKRASQLKFHADCLDYIRLLLPEAFDKNYSKRKIFSAVS